MANHLHLIDFHIVMEKHSQHWTFTYCEKNPNILVSKLQKRSQHWLLYLAKATQPHWFPRALKMTLSLAFIYCENNSITLVFKNFGNDLNINFCSLWKQLNYISFTSHLRFIRILFILSIHDFNQKFKSTS